LLLYIIMLLIMPEAPKPGEPEDVEAEVVK